MINWLQKNRYELSAVVESAQNELNLALLGKSCVLLSGPPAVGKSCLVSQLALLALNDKKQGSLLRSSSRCNSCSVG